MLEEEFDIDIDEGVMTPQTTVSELREIATAQQKEILYYGFPRWAVTRPVRVLRALLQAFIFRPLSLFSRTTVKGRENLNEIEVPVIFMANHLSHYDPIYIARAIPRHLRKLAIPTVAELIYEVKPEYSWRKKITIRFGRFVASLLMNAFPFSQERHLKKSFAYTGQLMDRGWNILFFPEGKLTATGEMNHFKPGIGLLAQAMRVPVVPVRVDGLYLIADYPHWFPRRFARVRITFGKPMYVDEKADPERVASEFENVIRYLS